VLVVDANVLLYAVNASSPQSEPSRRWLDAALDGGATVGFAWTVLLAFLRLSTHPAVFPRPLAGDVALGIARDWLGRATATTLEPTARHLDVLSELLAPLGSAGNLVADAHLAALAIEHRAELVSYDRDFERFPGIRRREP
jgi:toxin-antitoxin system PIN domain toxin